jgi:aminoglycoside phosphotransferase (APT) family kinase protein
VPIHKDFQYEHVIVGPSVAVVDLDEARMGDPAFDVAHFLTYLELLAFRSSVPSSDRDEWAEAFLTGYGAALEPERLRWYRAYTTVKIAKQLATGSGPHPRPPTAAAAAEAAFMLGTDR